MKNLVFISYSRSDKYFVEKLSQKLKSKGVKFWYDAKIEAGDHWDIKIEEKIESAKKLILVLSKSSIASQNVMDEVSFAMTKDKKIIPIIIEPCNVPMRVARFQQIDFTKSKKEGTKALLATLGVRPKLRNTINLIMGYIMLIFIGVIIGFGLAYLFQTDIINDLIN
ncbi:MAG: toll/interleukin-1 receptor domain-containing protein [Bacteroidia bacterium]|nr:toll/interleukin-1 receptor domain-containing protein [Bacteroidia bacterium]